MVQAKNDQTVKVKDGVLLSNKGVVSRKFKTFLRQPLVRRVHLWMFVL